MPLAKTVLAVRRVAKNKKGFTIIELKNYYVLKEVIVIYKTSKIEIEALGGQKILLNLDGEYGGDAPVQFDNLKGHLDMYVNLDEINDDHYLGDEETLALEAVAQKFAEEANKIKDEDEED